MPDNITLHQYSFSVPYGIVVLTLTAQGLRAVISLPADHPQSRSTVQSASELNVAKAIQAFQLYFSDPHVKINVPIVATGTDFQQRVWRHLCTIPVGQAQTYGEVAAALNTSPRAVANACRRNPIPIIVPCHRVISAQGIGGYAGKTSGFEVDVKQWLLAHESAA